MSLRSIIFSCTDQMWSEGGEFQEKASVADPGQAQAVQEDVIGEWPGSSPGPGLLPWPGTGYTEGLNWSWEARSEHYRMSSPAPGCKHLKCIHSLSRLYRNLGDRGTRYGQVEWESHSQAVGPPQETSAGGDLRRPHSDSLWTARWLTRL